MCNKIMNDVLVWPSPRINMINICYKQNIKSHQIKSFQNTCETPSWPAVNLWLDMYNTVYYDFIWLNVKFSKGNCHELSACLASGRSHKCRLIWNVAARCLCFSAVLERAFQMTLIITGIDYLNNKVFLTRNYRLIVARGNLMFLKQIFARKTK